MNYRLMSIDEACEYLECPDANVEVDYLVWEEDRMMLTRAEYGEETNIRWAVFTEMEDGGCLDECFVLPNDMVLMGAYLSNEAILTDLDRTLYQMVKEGATPEQIVGYLNL